MDGNGFTGLNPELAKRNIQNFYDAAIDAWVKLDGAFSYLFEELYWKWCSPKAVKFSDKYHLEIKDLNGALRTTIDNVVINAQSAYNSVAGAHGTPRIQVDYLDSNHPMDPSKSNKNFNAPKLVAEHPTNFAVGMNIQLVKLVLEGFNSMTTEALTMLKELPTEIALFDTENAQQFAFENIIQKIVGMYTVEITRINTDINSAIETETNSALLAKEQATQTLNG